MKVDLLQFASGDSMFEATLTGGALIVLFSEGALCGGMAIASILQDSDAAALLEQMRSRMTAEFPAAKTFEAKLVGPHAMVGKLRRACVAAGINVRSELVNPGRNQRIMCRPGLGRILIEQSKPEPAQGPAAVKARVLIVDDSKTMLKVLQRILSSDPGIEVVGTVSNPLEIEAEILKTKPDVMTLDMYMPEMDGCQVLEKLMPRHPVPTVLISSITRREAPEILRALELGAVDFISKPKLEEMEAAAPVIAEKVRAVASAKVSRAAPPKARRSQPSVRISPGSSLETRLIAIGSSTGGTEALKELLLDLPAQIPPILCVQHIPPVFSAAFAERLNLLCPFEVKEAKDGDEVRAGLVLIAPGAFHMAVEPCRSSPTGYRVRVFDGEPVNRHKPSVDVLFDSVARHCSASAIGVILTGMGADGAKGLLNMVNAGAHTVAQDEASCVVFGMPKEAIRLGAAQEVRPLNKIADKIEEWLKESPRFLNERKLKF